MKQLSTIQRVQIIAALVEGNSINSTVRMTGISKPTILKLLADLGTACQLFHDNYVHSLSCERIECDEIWSFIKSKEKNVPEAYRGMPGHGDIWTWTAICADTKLMVNWHFGDRTKASAQVFMDGVALRLNEYVQISTDGLKAYVEAIQNSFNGKVDHGIIIKTYGVEKNIGAARYSPPKITSLEKEVGCGSPNIAAISTSFVERANLTIRMGMRRYTRLTNGFSKKIENHVHMTAIFFTYYNFCRKHMTLKTTPAISAKLTDRVWKIEDMIELISRFI